MKKLLIALVALVMVLVVGAVTLMLPPVQRAILLSVLEGEVKAVSVESFSAGLGGADVSGLELTLQDDTRLSLEQAEVDFSLIGLLGGSYDFSHVEIKDVVVTLPPEAEKSEEEDKEEKPEEAFDGILRPLREAGIRLRVTDLKANGKVLGHQLGTIEWSAKSVEPITAGHIGEIVMEAAFPDNASREAVLPRSLDGILSVQLAEAGYPVELKTELILSNVSNHYRLRAQILETSDEQGETYRLDLDYETASGMEQVLVYLGLDYRYEKRELSGIYKANADEALLNAFALTREPLEAINFAAEGSLKCEMGTATAKSQIDGTLRVNLPDPQKWEPTLGELGPMGLDLRFAAQSDKDSLSVNTLSGRLHSLKAPSLIDLSLDQPFILPLGEDWEKYTLPEGSLVTLDMDAPLAIVGALLGGGLSMEGKLAGKLQFRATPDSAFVFEAQEPMEVRIDKASSGDELLLESFVLRAAPEVTYTADRTQAVLKKLELLSYGESAGSAEVSFVMLDGQDARQEVTASQQVELTPLFKQPALKPHARYLPDEPLTMKLDYQLTQRPDFLKLQRLESSLRDASGKTFLLTRTAKAIEVPTQQERFAFETYSGELVHFEAQDFPLALVAPFVSGSNFSGALNGTLTTSVSNGELRIVSEEALAVKALRLVVGEEAWFENADIRAKTEVRFAEASWSLSLEELDASERGKPALSGSFQGRFGGADLPEELGLDLKADLGILLGKAGNVKSGKGELVLKMEGTQEAMIDAALSLSNLKLKDDSSTLKSMQASFEGTFQPEPFAITGKLPLKAQGDRAVTDVEVTVKLGGGLPAEEQHLIVRGEALDVDDVLMVSRLWKSEEAQEVEGTKQPEQNGKKPGRDEEPFWSGIGGRIDIQVEHIYYDDLDIQSLRGNADIQPTALVLDAVEAKLHDAPLMVEGTVTYDTARAKLYDFTGSVNVQELSLGRTFDISGWIDGLFTIKADARSQGDNIDQLLEHMMGELALTSNEGTLYFFEQGSGLMGSLSGLLNQTGGLLGELTGKVLPFDMKIISDISGFMQKLSFYNFDVAIERGDTLDLMFNRIRVDGAMMSVSGSGKVTHMPDEALVMQPLSIKLQLGVKDALASSLGVLGLTSDKVDEKGYTEAFSFPVDGSLGKPNFGIQKPIKKAITGLLPLGGGSKKESATDASGQDSSHGNKKPQVEQAVEGLIKGLF